MAPWPHTSEGSTLRALYYHTDQQKPMCFLSRRIQDSELFLAGSSPGRKAARILCFYHSLWSFTLLVALSIPAVASQTLRRGVAGSGRRVWHRLASRFTFGSDNQQQLTREGLEASAEECGVGRYGEEQRGHCAGPFSGPHSPLTPEGLPPRRGCRQDVPDTSEDTKGPGKGSAKDSVDGLMSYKGGHKTTSQMFYPKADHQLGMVVHTHSPSTLGG